ARRLRNQQATAQQQHEGGDYHKSILAHEVASFVRKTLDSQPSDDKGPRCNQDAGTEGDPLQTHKELLGLGLRRRGGRRIGWGKRVRRGQRRPSRTKVPSAVMAHDLRFAESEIALLQTQDHDAAALFTRVTRLRVYAPSKETDRKSSP